MEENIVKSGFIAGFPDSGWGYKQRQALEAEKEEDKNPPYSF